MWKDIPGFEGLYSVNELGQIFSVRSNKILKTNRRVNNSGYESVSLQARCVKSVHWCVAMAWLGYPPFLKADVNHKNGSKRDNRPENLEWVSRKENMKHAKELGLIGIRRSYRGIANPNAKLTNENITQILFLKENGSTQSEIAKKFNVKQCTISQVLRKNGVKSFNRQLAPR